MKTILLFSLSFIAVSSAFAGTKCNDLTILQRAAQNVFKPGEARATNVTYLGKSKAGLDTWNVDMVFDDSTCVSDVSISTKAGTCTIVGNPFEVPGNRECD